MEDNGQEKKLSEVQNLKRKTLLVPLQAGCLTFIVAGIALAIGLWIDIRQETIPRWTLILLLGSLPLTIGGIILIVRRTLKSMRHPENPEE
jgi:hypothetical protein